MPSREWFRAAFTGLDHAIVWTTVAAVILLMASMVAAVVLGVFFRYVVNAALPWPEEFARFAMIWVTLLGAGLVLRYTGHIAVVFVVERLPAALRRLVVAAGKMLVAVFLVLLLVKGWEMTERVRHQTAPALEISMSIPNLALPAGALLMLYHLAVIAFAGSHRRPRLPGLGGDG